MVQERLALIAVWGTFAFLASCALLLVMARWVAVVLLGFVPSAHRMRLVKAKRALPFQLDQPLPLVHRPALQRVRRHQRVRWLRN